MRFSPRSRSGLVLVTVLALIASGLVVLVPSYAANQITNATAASIYSANAQDEADWLAEEVGEIPSDADIARAERKANQPDTRAKKKKKPRNYSAAKVRARSQCIPYGRWKGLSDDAKRANDLMRRHRTTIDPYGTLRVKKNPNWRRQSSLDYSGNGHMHSLFWALPLLRVGVKKKNKRMVTRFYEIIHDWIKDNPPNRPRQRAAYSQITAGYRMLTLACAFAGPAPRPAYLLKAMKTQQKVASKTWRSVNNASFHHASGIYAMGCVTGKRSYKRRGLSLLSRITGAMVATDGSVREGSVSYAFSTYGWTKQEMLRVAGCRSKIPGKLRRVDKIPQYLGTAIRPDRRFESIGDGHPDVANERYAPAKSWWQYSATEGAKGTRPNTLYKPYQAGVLFARSGWGKDKPFRQETFYSLRYGPGPAYQYHAHHDGASLTLAANGKQVLVDPGQYRLHGGDVASYLRTRSAHNTVTATGLKAASTAPLLRHTQSSSEGDYTAVLDRPYKDSRIERKVWYDRKGEFFVVMDDVSLAKKTSLFQNWNLGADRTVKLGPVIPAPVDPEPDPELESPDSESLEPGNSEPPILETGQAHTEGSGADVSILSVANAPTYRVYKGSKNPWSGWTSSKYGSIAKTPSVRVSTSAKTVRLVTVIIPRPSDVEAIDVSATGELIASGAIVQVRAADGQDYRLRLNQRSVERLPLLPDEPDPTETPTGEPTDDPTDDATGDPTGDSL